MPQARYAIRIVDWTMEPEITFKLPERRLTRDLLELLDSLGSEHPIVRGLEVAKNPIPAFTRNFLRIRREADHRPIYNRQSDRFCAAEAAESLIASFQTYLDGFKLGLVVRMNDREPHLKLRCQDSKLSLQFRLLAALLAITQDGDIRLVRRCVVCGRWMHAHQSSQLYDSKKCRQAAWQSIPEVKRKRDEGRSRRHRDDKAREKRELEIARRG